MVDNPPMARKRLHVRLDGTAAKATLHECSGDYIGPWEAVAVRERRFRLDDCERRRECLVLAATAGIEFWTCKGCSQSVGRWAAFAKADDAKHGGRYPSKRRSSTCRVHGVSMVKTSDKPRSRPRCPLCDAEHAQRLRDAWADDAKRATMIAKLRGNWDDPGFRARETEANRLKRAKQMEAQHATS